MAPRKKAAMNNVQQAATASPPFMLAAEPGEPAAHSDAEVEAFPRDTQIEFSPDSNADDDPAAEAPVEQHECKEVGDIAAQAAHAWHGSWYDSRYNSWEWDTWNQKWSPSNSWWGSNTWDSWSSWDHHPPARGTADEYHDVDNALKEMVSLYTDEKTRDPERFDDDSDAGADSAGDPYEAALKAALEAGNITDLRTLMLNASHIFSRGVMTG